MGISISKMQPSGYPALYARIFSSPAIRMDTGHAEVMVALYKDANARFSGAEPLGYERQYFRMAPETQEAIAAALYADPYMQAQYADGTPRDPDPEKSPAPDATIEAEETGNADA